MPIQVPDLDDRRYADLVQEGMALIPAYSSEWTNHNAADPGITFLELFAWLTDVFLYRLNRVSAANRLKFLKLLTGTDFGTLPHEELERALREAVVGLRQRGRAVTCADHEAIAREATASEPAERQVKRAVCFPRRDLDAPAPEQALDRPGHTSIIFVPGDPWAASGVIEDIRARVHRYFEPRRLLTARIHVAGPRYLDIGVRVRAALRPGTSPATVKGAAERELAGYFHPLSGGPGGSGWPFGQSVFVSDVYRLLAKVAGIVSVEEVELEASAPARLLRNEFGEGTEVTLLPEELVRVRLSAIELERPDRTSGGGARP